MSTPAAEFIAAKHAGLELHSIVFGKPVWKGTDEQYIEYDNARWWFYLLGWINL